MKFLVLLIALTTASTALGQLKFDDPSPQHYKLKARASDIDRRVRSHPEIGFDLESDDGK
ncbi:MAG: hypothetical protein HKN47_22005, partial [Pirellulaceae bacterium]|nr:hypothetical protein [Pirellulaceae bacterium]